MADADEYMISFCAFLETQDYLGNISADALRAARKRNWGLLRSR